MISNLTLTHLITATANELESHGFTPSDWDNLVLQSLSEGLAPLIYWNLSKSGKFSSIPDSARNSLRATYATTWMENQRIFKELEGLAQRFDEACIPLVVLKGACFALTIYPDIGLRPMGDLDILVPREKLAQAVQIAKQIGYEDAEQEAVPGLNDLLSHHACLQKPGSPARNLEIHDSLVADHSFAYAVPVDWFWEQTEPLDVPSAARFKNVRMLTPIAQMLFAAAHAMLQHGGKNAPLRWFYDLDLLIRFYGPRIDWDLLLAQAQRFEWGSALNAALSLTMENFDTPIPESVRTSLATLADRHTNLVVRQQTRSATHTLDEYQKMLTLTGYAGMRLLMALIAPSPAYMRTRYGIKNSWQLPTYYIFRWAGIFKDGIETFIHVISKIGRSTFLNRRKP